MYCCTAHHPFEALDSVSQANTSFHHILRASGETPNSGSISFRSRSSEQPPNVVLSSLRNRVGDMTHRGRTVSDANTTNNHHNNSNRHGQHCRGRTWQRLVSSGACRISTAKGQGSDGPTHIDQRHVPATFATNVRPRMLLEESLQINTSGKENRHNKC